MQTPIYCETLHFLNPSVTWYCFWLNVILFPSAMNQDLGISLNIGNSSSQCRCVRKSHGSLMFWWLYTPKCTNYVFFDNFSKTKIKDFRKTQLEWQFEALHKHPRHQTGVNKGKGKRRQERAKTERPEHLTRSAAQFQALKLLQTNSVSPQFDKSVGVS